MDDLLHAQLDHNTWATRQIIDACRAIDGDTFTRNFDIGPGSLQATIAHVIEAMLYFSATLRGDRYTQPAEFVQHAATADGLGKLLDDADRALHDAVATYLDEHFTRDRIPWPDSDRTYPAATVLAQVFDHGTHHRAQCLNMLRQTGQVDLPALDPLHHDDDGSR